MDSMTLMSDDDLDILTVIAHGIWGSHDTNDRTLRHAAERFTRSRKGREQ